MIRSILSPASLQILRCVGRQRAYLPSGVIGVTTTGGGVSSRLWSPLFNSQCTADTLNFHTACHLAQDLGSHNDSNDSNESNSSSSSSSIDQQTNNIMSSSFEVTAGTQMPPDDLFLFDLNGFIVVRGVFSPDQVAAVNAAVDLHREDAHARSKGAVRNTIDGTGLSGSGPRVDLGGFLGWEASTGRDVLRSVLAHPRLLPYLTTLCGPGYRLDHSPLIIMQGSGSEGFQLHGGTVDCGSGRHNPTLAYTCHQGKPHCALLACSLVLADHGPGDGGFVVVRGSHKSNFAFPAAMRHGDSYAEHLHQPVMRAGDVLLFSEGTVHGATGWSAEHERRIALYRFTPHNMAYGRAYVHEGGWPESYTEGMSPAELAVMQPPFARRLDRSVVAVDGTVTIERRSAEKKAFDRTVFGTQYF